MEEITMINVSTVEQAIILLNENKAITFNAKGGTCYLNKNTKVQNEYLFIMQPKLGKDIIYGNNEIGIRSFIQELLEQDIELICPKELILVQTPNSKVRNLLDNIIDKFNLKK